MPNIVCPNDYPGLTLTYFVARYNYFCNLGLSIGKIETVDFSETFAACDLKVGIYEGGP